MATVESVTGPIELDGLGTTLIHEHLKVRSEPSGEQYPHLYDEDDAYRRATEQARAVMEQGVKTIVDPSCLYLGRDIGFMRRVAEDTGLQVIAATGIYTYSELPQVFKNRDEDFMADAFVHDIEEGIQGTDIKAAFLKCAVDEPGITDDVRKVLRACARASKRTGRPIMAHSHPGTRRGLEIMDILDDEGVDPKFVQIAHTGDTDDLEYIGQLLGRGPYIGMDRYGLDMILETEKRNRTVLALLEQGHAERMSLATDACWEFDWFSWDDVAQLAPNWKPTFVYEQVVPALREGGMTDDQLETMMVAVPRSWLAAT
ncbi:MAG: phosphotriesterase [Thermoleophilaceae bacterium]